ncbi:MULTISPECIES: ABC-F family ATP-binding cassette domain-containing protein [Arthrobacter]|uniref:ATP-binding cassette domain-containing protein n=1 Tax=Arthrobacter caoxuetaonis TaxID=2886935 RepID=A0A9X1SCU0_9MICC|nr:ATP-binding cassette domain-containing protein [Arthrobacter caoxuetaonis]MCC3281804.1 ATP-binding cassette domain-containing protein [Arthrobacter caoxuetaonis]MCC3298528.1 ATP-binding cassette domain-containing protein [Arthrobacter caoxuetaonis]MCC9194753.1 ATP-binding cassette domain-containing protein [Arthrobacter sp. zg-Y916]USQ57274.1 ATP-binding cassette domain-containing protein [Arthrobacter caoxuetaonis]
MAHLDVSNIDYFLSDGRQLLSGVSFKVGDGHKTALIGPNGTGKTTLLRIIAEEIKPDEGTVSRSGNMGIMRQFVGQVRDGSTVRDLLVSAAPPAIAAAARAVDEAELAMMENDDEPTQMRYAQAIADWGDAGGYEQETVWDEVTMAALGMPFDSAQYRKASTLSGGEQKRLVLEALFTGPDQLLLLDEPDNYLDVPGKRWLEAKLAESKKSVLFVSHDRELLANAATRIVTLEPGINGASAWIHGGAFESYVQAREDRNARFEELRRRWDEEHVKLKELVNMYKNKAAFRSDMANRYHAAQTRLAKFLEAGPPEALPIEQNVQMRLRGGRTAKRAVVAEKLELTGLMKPFSTEIWFGDRVGVLGSNGSGKSHFLRLLAAGGSDPDKEHEPVSEVEIAPVPHEGSVKLGARIRPGFFAQTMLRQDLLGKTLLDILHRGDEHRSGLGREAAAGALDRYGLASQGEQKYESLSGGQQARLQILLLELSGATLLLLDEPTDNLDLHSAEALEKAIDAFEGTVLAVTHDRWFARSFDRFLVFGSDGRVYESEEPVWDEKRVERVR